MGLVDDQELPQTFVPHRSDPTFSNSIRIRRSKWRMNDCDAFRLEDGIKRRRELGVVVVDQEAGGWRSVFQCPDHRAAC